MFVVFGIDICVIVLYW